MLRLYGFILFYYSLQAVRFARAFRHPVEVISAEGRDVILPINETGVSEIYWIFDKTHIGTTRAEGRIEVKNNKFRGRLHCVDGVSLKISNVTRKDQGTYTANVLEVHPQFHLKVYPVLLDNDINIHANLTNNETCSLALTCLTNASNVTIFWRYPNTSDLYISDRTVHISNVYPNITCKCTAKNPVSNVSRTVTPGQYCHQEGDTSRLQIDECPPWGIVLPIIAFMIIIIIIFLLYKKRKSKNIGTEKDTEVSTICDKVPLAEPSLRQKQLAVYTQLQHVIQLQGKYALGSGSCGEMKHVISQESGDVLLQVDKPGVIEISWVFLNTLIAMTRPHEPVEVKSRQFKNRLYNGTNGSLNITKLTKENQGEFVANLRSGEEECNQNFHLTVYSKLSDGDINIHHNVTRSGTCNVTLTCAIDKKDVSISWKDSMTNTVIRTSTIQVADPYTNSSWTCTVSHPVASVSRTVIPLDFCQNESKWVIVLFAVFTCLSLLAIITLICWKKHNYICTRMKWKRENKLASTSDDPQQTEHVYWDIDHSKACSKTEATARTSNPKIDPVYMTSLRLSGKSAYKRGDLLQGDDSVQMYCDWKTTQE
ncbi:uncharacterized protein LOC120920119 [Rana temporaria]|uniref:uncharacterized protein LOC120920119 n=1 Tax=Rana temporaria TaxID=8407 RepID=UPI001AAC7E2B|nr:uncharacterized protein LOC120920119 [Rana temporaria]